MTKIQHWLISDTHFSHKNIVKYCGRTIYMNDREKELYKKFNQSEEWKDNPNDFQISDETVIRMNNDIIGNINDRVKENDILWHLGDFGFANNWEKHCEEYRKRIICKNFMFCFGNHDISSKRDLSWFTKCFDILDVCIFQDGQFCIGDDVRWHHNKKGNITITLCHYALATWNRSHRGSWHCYGHSHSQLESQLDQFFPGRKSLDVGIDNIYKLCGYYGPVNLEQIYQIFATKEEKLCQPQDLMI